MRAANTQCGFFFMNDDPRPAGSGQMVDGFFIYNMPTQRVDQVAYTISSTVQHVYHHIQEGAFPNAVDISVDGAARACYRIPRQDVVDFLESRKEGITA